MSSQYVLTSQDWAVLVRVRLQSAMDTLQNAQSNYVCQYAGPRFPLSSDLDRATYLIVKARELAENAIEAWDREVAERAAPPIRSGEFPVEPKEAPDAETQA